MKRRVLGFALWVLCLGASPPAWAGIDADELLMKPWLTDHVFVADPRFGKAQVSLYYALENPSGTSATLGGQYVWEVKSVEDGNNYVRSGIMDFVGQYVWPHASSISGIVEDTYSPHPPIHLDVPPGRYTYRLTLQEDDGTFVTESSTQFEVQPAPAVLTP